MRVLSLAVAVLLAASAAQAAEVFGVWKSETNDEGKYLHVEVHPCANDAAKVCGTIVGAFGGAKEENIGKPIIWDMVPEGTNEWGGGKIWAPDDDETYSSEMELEGEILEVEGCILGGLICRGQDWTRVN